MPPSTTPDSPLPPSTSESSENNLQPFFVLHKASSRNSKKCSPASGRTRRKIDLSPFKNENVVNSESGRGEDLDDRSTENLQRETFNFVWSNIESTIKGVLRKINVNVFSGIHRWVSDSFDRIQSFQKPDPAVATRLFPIVTSATSNQLFTGLVLTKNMEFVDDLLTFEELGLYLKTHGCHVANLSSQDFSMKIGISGCLKSILRQFLMVSFDAPDISILASWYWEQENFTKPIVVIIEDMERCCGSVVSDFILMLSEWVLKIPVILIMGVATSLDAPRTILSTNALQHLCPSRFILGSPAERMDAVVEAVLVKQSPGFSIGYDVAVFMKNYFLRQDGTLTSFIRSLKIACAQHVTMNPLNILLRGYLVEKGGQGLLSEIESLFTDVMLKNIMAGQTGDTLAQSLSELKELQKCWSAAVLCLHEAGKHAQIPLLSLFCEALDPNLCNSMASQDELKLDKDSGMLFAGGGGDADQSLSKGLIRQAVLRVRNLPGMLLGSLLKSWEEHIAGISEIHGKVKELQSMLTSEDDSSLRRDATSSKRNTPRSQLKTGRESVNQRAAKLLEYIIRDHMKPIESAPFHEIISYKNVEKLQLALIGDPRRRIQIDLLEAQKLLRCSCCSKTGNALHASLPDTSIMYTLAQEHGDLINLHDWYQSFKAVITAPRSKAKQKKIKVSPSPKKRKHNEESEKLDEATIQARFCRAVSELQITGLLRMPSKRRPDYVQRVAFGL